MITEIEVYPPLRGYFHIKPEQIKQLKNSEHFSYLEPAQKQQFLESLKQCGDLTIVVNQSYLNTRGIIMRIMPETLDETTRNKVFQELLPHLS